MKRGEQTPAMMDMRYMQVNAPAKYEGMTIAGEGEGAGGGGESVFGCSDLAIGGHRGQKTMQVLSWIFSFNVNRFWCEVTSVGWCRKEWFAKN